MVEEDTLTTSWSINDKEVERPAQVQVAIALQGFRARPQDSGGTPYTCHLVYSGATEPMALTRLLLFGMI